MIPKIGSRWCRPNFLPARGVYNGYTVLQITNTEHTHERHPPQVVYEGDNGRMWSLPLSNWPGNLESEDEGQPGIEKRIIDHLDKEENMQDPLDYLVGHPEREQREHIRPLPAEGFVFSLNGQAYKVIYVNKGKKRLSIEPTGEQFTDRARPEGLCLMWYECKNCGCHERLWNSRPRVTPFTVSCAVCPGSMTHINWGKDEYAPNHVPQKGERIFVDFSYEAAQMFYFKHVEECWDDDQYPMKDQYGSKKEAVKALLKTWEFGHPAVATI